MTRRTLLLPLLLIATGAWACCMVPRTYNGTIGQDAQEAVLIHDDGREELILRINYRITGDTLPVQGSDGSFSRNTIDGDAIDAVSLQPLEAFTADPAPTSDAITWTPAEGDYFYTCRVTSHTGMTGAIRVRAAS